MLTGRQIREARALLKLDHAHLAKRAKIITKATLVRAEAVDDEPPITIAQADAIRQTLERAGVIFAETDGEQPGVRLKKARPVASTNNGNPPGHMTDPDEADRGRR